MHYYHIRRPIYFHSFVSLDYVNTMKRMARLSDEALAKYQTTFKSVYLCQDTFLSASVAVGCVLNTVDHVMKGKVHINCILGENSHVAAWRDALAKETFKSYAFGANPVSV